MASKARQSNQQSLDWTGLLGLISLTASAQVQHRSFTPTANSHIMDIVLSLNIIISDGFS